MDDGIIGPAIYGNIMYKGGKPDVPLKTNGGQFHNIYQNIFIDSPVAVNIFTMTGTATTGYYRPGRWYVYLTDMYDLYGGGNSNLFGPRKELMFSDKWRKYYDEAMTVARDRNALQHQVNTAKTNLEDALYRFRSAENDPLASLDIDKISIDTLIADKDGWTTGAGDDVVIRDGSMIVGNGAATLAEYTAKNYKNAQFNFTMRAEAIDPSLSNARDAYVGIYLRQGKNGWCWENDNTASMLDLKQNLIQYLQYPAPADWGGAVKDDMIQSGEKIELGKTYLVAAGIYDTKVDGQVYLELSLDGKKIYSQVVLGTGMYGKEGHFAISAGET